MVLVTDTFLLVLHDMATGESCGLLAVPGNNLKDVIETSWNKVAKAHGDDTMDLKVLGDVHVSECGNEAVACVTFSMCCTWNSNQLVPVLGTVHLYKEHTNPGKVNEYINY